MISHTDIGSLWSGWNPQYDMSLANKVRILEKLGEYLRLEYQRHTRRHAFYEEYGHGCWHLLQCVENPMPTLTT